MINLRIERDESAGHHPDQAHGRGAERSSDKDPHKDSLHPARCRHPLTASGFDGLRAGEFDVLVGVNPPRRPRPCRKSLAAILSMPTRKVSCAAIASLTQTVGRAARNLNGTGRHNVCRQDYRDSKLGHVDSSRHPGWEDIEVGGSACWGSEPVARV